MLKITDIKERNEKQYNKSLRMVKRNSEIYKQQIIETHGNIIPARKGEDDVNLFRKKLSFLKTTEQVKKLITSTLGYYTEGFSEEIIEVLIDKGALFDIVTDNDPFVLDMLYCGLPSQSNLEEMLEAAKENRCFKVARLTYNELLKFNEDYREDIVRDTWLSSDYGSFDDESDCFCCLLDMLEDMNLI